MSRRNGLLTTVTTTNKIKRLQKHLKRKAWFDKRAKRQPSEIAPDKVATEALTKLTSK